MNQFEVPQMNFGSSEINGKSLNFDRCPKVLEMLNNLVKLWEIFNGPFTSQTAINLETYIWSDSDSQNE